jgi:uncharacterized protein YbbC (DUF1343 family)
MSTEVPRIDRRRLLGAAAAGAVAAPLLTGSAGASTEQVSPLGGGEAVRTGAERAAGDGWSVLSGDRVGIITNPTGVLRNLRNIVDEMHESGAVQIAGVFGPEHGFRGTAQAGGSEGTFVDERTGLTVYDAYGANVAKMTELFTTADVETVVFDIQDVGSRFYTYIWTMYLAMEAAARLGLRFVVLDRPNPLSGRDAFGPVLHAEYSSFVGLKPIAQQHGMTVGELARLFNDVFVPEATGGRRTDLHVERLVNWRREQRFTDTGLPWVAPSPNMPTPRTAELYVGTCYFEATALSEGRGTTLPFQLLGAPGIDHRWEQALNARSLPGVRFREAYFTPTFSKWQAETCGGVEVQVTDVDAHDPIRTALTMITEQWRLFPEYRWRSQDGDGAFWLDKLSGDSRVRLAVEDGVDPGDIPRIWEDELAAFRRLRRGYLLYR